MARSQRHQLENYSATSAGETLAQGTVAPGMLMQLDMGNPLEEPVEVPIGDPGGPLGGSSLTGAIPDRANAPFLTSLDPLSALIQSGDVTINIWGGNFTAETVLLWNGADDVAAFIDATHLTTVVKTDFATIPSTCTVAVRNGDVTSNELEFHLTEGG